MLGLKSFEGFQPQLPYGLVEKLRHSQLCNGEWLVLPGTLNRSCCWLHGLLCSLRSGDQPNVTFDITTLATSKTYSSRFLTPVLVVAIALALITAHWERDVRSGIKSQVPRRNFTRRLRAVKGQATVSVLILSSSHSGLHSAHPPSPPLSNTVDHDFD
ncbi:hypothetical protein PoB_004603200 [Plakobranchus ocellatus]|uniref:Uncharacterized protein n=1 Tax=Plakobranchus ocellatus TaxID=259542 RepID=A0AAV4BJF4_9GAST|nr:hypothetical protein PoB_004603200 [Plakobranchus ocellatus]